MQQSSAGQSKLLSENKATAAHLPPVVFLWSGDFSGGKQTNLKRHVSRGFAETLRWLAVVITS
jgi:hypothetical protein